MNRQQRRQQERERDKYLKAVKSLTPTQAKLVNLIAEEKAKAVTEKHIQTAGELFDRNITAALLIEGWSLEKVYKFQDSLIDLLSEDTEKYKILEKENVDMEKIEKEVKDYIKVLLDMQVEEKEAMKDLSFKFPTLSKSMLKNAYEKVKREHGKENKSSVPQKAIDFFNNNSGVLNSNEMISAAMNKFNFTQSTAQTYYYKWKKDFMKPIPTDKKEPVVKKNLKTECVNKKENKENKKENVKMEGLKVLEEKVIKTVKVKGENGIYEGKTGEGIILEKDGAQVKFNNVKELDKWTSEVREVLKMVGA